MIPLKRSARTPERDFAGARHRARAHIERTAGEHERFERFERVALPAKKPPGIALFLILAKSVHTA